MHSLVTSLGNTSGYLFRTSSKLCKFTRFTRKFGAYEGRTISDEELIKEEDDWKSKMFTRLRDGTVIPVMHQTVYMAQDNPQSIFNAFESAIIKFTWDETYDDAWESQEPEFEEGELPKAVESQENIDPTQMEYEMIRRASSGR